MQVWVGGFRTDMVMWNDQRMLIQATTRPSDIAGMITVYSVLGTLIHIVMA